MVRTDCRTHPVCKVHAFKYTSRSRQKPGVLHPQHPLGRAKFEIRPAQTWGKNAITSARSFVSERRDARPDEDAHLRLKFARLSEGHFIRLFGSPTEPLEHTSSSPVCTATVRSWVVWHRMSFSKRACEFLVLESSSSFRMRAPRLASYVALRPVSAKRYVADEVCVLLACLLTKKLVYLRCWCHALVQIRCSACAHEIFV